MNTRVRAALGMSGFTPDGKVTKAQGVIDAMQGSGNFPSASLPVNYSSLQTIVDDLHNAILATNAGTAANTSAMHEQERILVIAFNLIRAHVEYVANNTTTPESIINSAGMQVMATGGSNAVTELTLQADGNGSITIRVPRGQNEKAFVFEKSTDGTAFSKVASSILTKISITGLQVASTIYIRYYAIGKNGDGAYSQVKNVIVL